MNCCDRCPFRAVRNRHLDCLRLLTVDELLATDSHHQTALHLAVRLNYLDIIAELLQLAPQLNDQPSALGETPTLISAALGHLECLQALLQGGLNEGLNRALITDLNGTSVLMASVVRG
jgi:ankyrin repeat protein